MDKPFSQACENNKTPILEVLKRHFDKTTRVLEIGSGTGQHSVFFAKHLTHLQWLTSDLPDNHQGIHLQMADCGLNNLHPPVELNAQQTDWPITQFDGVFSANTTHIMSWPSVQSLFKGIGRYLSPNGTFCLYGPFNYHGKFTSESNARFDLSLKQRESHMGIRDFEAVNALAKEQHLSLIEDIAMPANNRVLVWRR